MTEVTEKTIVTGQLKIQREKDLSSQIADKRDVMVMFSKDFHIRSPTGKLLFFPADPEPQPVPWDIISLVQESKTAHAEILKNIPLDGGSVNTNKPPADPVLEEKVKMNEQPKPDNPEPKLGSSSQDSGTSKK